MDLARNLIGRINVGDSLTRIAAARPAQSRSSTGRAGSAMPPSTPTSTIQKNVVRSEYARHYEED